MITNISGQIKYTQNNYYNSSSVKNNYKPVICRANADVVSFTGKDNLLSVKLRKARLTDIPEILKIERLCFPESEAIYGNNVAYLERSLRTDLSHVLAIDENGDVIGHMHMQPNYIKGRVLRQRLENLYERLPQGSLLSKPVELVRRLISFTVKDMWLNSMAVHPNAQGRKVGYQMMLTVVDQALARKAKKIGLLVETENKVAQNLYKKFGFEIKLKRENVYAKGKHAYLMEADLTNPEIKARLEQLRRGEM